VPVRRVVVDDSRYSGPSVNPAWEAGDIPSDYASPITAVMVDGGRASPSAVIRSSTPDLDAGRALAAQLGVPGAPVTRGTAPPTARVLGTVRSAPMPVLIGQMLQQSDNVIAECLARQVAVASHQPASFDGAATAVRSTLAALGVDVGAGLHDGSGLATTDRVAAAALVDVLRLIVSPEHPQLHPVVAGLPVAAWSGTLADRFLSGSAAGGAGVVRAKTGTLTGVSALAGLVHDRSGRLLAFALLADQVPATGTAAAEAALDRIAATLAACGCTS
jgi:D-alanyl-D-alanine carboxypeptidase/D-alanyl-D-alanine-endopeptidase (penicillin-binding protein 4)